MSIQWLASCSPLLQSQTPGRMRMWKGRTRLEAGFSLRCSPVWPSGTRLLTSECSLAVVASLLWTRGTRDAGRCLVCFTKSIAKGVLYFHNKHIWDCCLAFPLLHHCVTLDISCLVEVSPCWGEDVFFYGSGAHYFHITPVFLGYNFSVHS